MYYIGLDVHKKTISYCVKDGSGRVHDEGTIPATRAELDRWLCQVKVAKSRFSRKRQEFRNCSTGAHHLSPIGKSPVSEESMMVCFEMMTTDSEQVLNGTVNGEKTLGLFY